MKITFTNRIIKRLEKTISEALKLNNMRLFKISKSLLMVAKGLPVTNIAKEFQVSGRTIYNWIWRFIYERFSWLCSLHYQGRGAKSKLTNKQKDILYYIVVGGPEKYGFGCGVWNSPMIAEVIWREFNVLYNPRYLCRLLKTLGLSFQKAAFEADCCGQVKTDILF